MSPSLPRIDVSRAASNTVVCGSSGSGKSTLVKREIHGRPRVLVWDVDAEYCDLPGFRIVRSGAELLRLLEVTRAGRLAFVPRSAKDFELWSLAALAWGDCTVVAEETADVTSPGKAPAGWGQLVRRGRKRGVELYAVTQAPSESDKTVMRNRSRLLVGYLERADDRAYLARELDVDQGVIDALQPLEWLERRRGSQELQRSKLTF